MEDAKKWFQLAVLLGIGIVFSVLAAFLCAGLIMLVLDYPEAAVFCAVAAWILHFGWRTRDNLGLDEEDHALGENRLVLRNKNV